MVSDLDHWRPSQADKLDYNSHGCTYGCHVGLVQSEYVGSML